MNWIAAKTFVWGDSAAFAAGDQHFMAKLGQIVDLPADGGTNGLDYFCRQVKWEPAR